VRAQAKAVGGLHSIAARLLADHVQDGNVVGIDLRGGKEIVYCDDLSCDTTLCIDRATAGNSIVVGEFLKFVRDEGRDLSNGDQ
jgi:hypothetical protein